MKRKMSCLVVAVMCLAFVVSCGKGSGKTLVSINGSSITEGDLDFLATMNPRLKMQIATPFGKKQILDNLVEQELLYQAALKKGIQRDKATKAKIELYKKVIIAQSLIENEMKAAAKDYYDKNKNEFEKLQLAHIEVKYGPPSKDKKVAVHSKDQALKIANDIKKRLDGGEDFAKVAKEVSEDVITKNNGGDLGGVSKGDQRLERRGLGPLIEKAFTMQVGEVAGPIETQEGYHIITVTKGAELEPYESAEQAILMKIQGDQRTKILGDLKKNAKIVYPEDEKKKAEAAKKEAAQAPAAPEVKAPAAPTAPAAPAPAKPAPAPVKPAPAPAAPAKK